MFKRFAAAAIVTGSFVASAAPAAAQTDAAIRAKIIQASIDSYPGSCPCPYNVDRGGRRCGGRSAYNRGGGYAPKCFPGDIGPAEVKAFRAGR